MFICGFIIKLKELFTSAKKKGTPSIGRSSLHGELAPRGSCSWDRSAHPVALLLVEALRIYWGPTIELGTTLEARRRKHLQIRRRILGTNSEPMLKYKQDTLRNAESGHRPGRERAYDFVAWLFPKSPIP